MPNVRSPQMSRRPQCGRPLVFDDGRPTKGANAGRARSFRRCVEGGVGAQGWAGGLEVSETLDVCPFALAAQSAPTNAQRHVPTSELAN